MHVALFAFVLTGFLWVTGASAKQSVTPQNGNSTCERYEAGWRDAEKRVWKDICDTGRYRGSTNKSVQRDVIRSSCIRDLWIKKPYSETIALAGLNLARVKITGDLAIAGDLDFKNMSIPGGMVFENVELEGASVRLNGAQVSGPIEIFGESELGALDLSEATVEGHLYVGKGVGQLQANSAKLKRDVNVQAVSPVYLEQADIGGNLEIGRSYAILPVNSVNGAYLKVGGTVTISNGEGQSKFCAESVDFSHANFKQDFILQDACFTMLSLTEAEIGGSVDVYGGNMSDLTATGVHIGRELELGPSPDSGALLTWSKDSEISLDNSRIARIVSPRNLSFWPESISLHDAQFESLVSPPPTETPEGKRIRIKQLNETEWYLAWLKRATFRKSEGKEGGEKEFDEQPYSQVIADLTKSGNEDVRDAVGYEKREQERDVACARSSFWQIPGIDCVYLSFSKWLLGYGYQFRRTVVAVFIFVALGTIAFYFAPRADKRGLRFGIVYSFDMFIPLIRLRELHYKVDIKNWVRYYFYVHKLAGWVIGTFLVAALGGFTK